ncbi:MAG: SUMF1/EgtB/PvdO family nonheme iron enzyme [Chloroflexota bacterium]
MATLTKLCRIFYEETLARVSETTEVSQRLLRLWFDHSLITPARTRGLVYRGETHTEGMINVAVDALNDAYLIRATIRSGDTWYELAHDRLVEPILTANRNWQTTYFNPLAAALQEWISSGRNSQRLLRGTQLTEARAFADAKPGEVLEEEKNFLATSIRYLNPLSLAAQTWLDGGQETSSLLSGKRLEQAKAYASKNPENITPEEQNFLNTSLRYEATKLEEERQKTQRRRRFYVFSSALIVILTLMVIFAVIFALRFNDLALRTRRQAEIAETAKAQAIASANEAQAGSTAAAIAQVEAEQQRETAVAQANIAATAQQESKDSAILAFEESDRAQAALLQAQEQQATSVAAQQTAEADRNSANEARAALATNLAAALATPTPTETPTVTPTPTATNTPIDVEPSAAEADTPTHTLTPTPTATATPDLAATATSGYQETAEAAAVATQLAQVNIELTAAAVEQTAEAQRYVVATETAQARSDEMAFVPAGRFLMGSLSNTESQQLPGIDRNPEAEGDEMPQRTVVMSDFWIDLTEVTNAAYTSCVQAGVCPRQRGGDPNFHSNPAFGRFPAVFVSWVEAETYCDWRGKRLPSEAEWEKAARASDGRIWPWGNALKDNVFEPVQRANVGDSDIGRIVEVGTMQGGESPYGVLDMSGNVWEWTRDFYEPLYYRSRPDPDNDPLGPSKPSGSERRVIRGGSYLTPGIDARTSERNGVEPHASFDIGFRCAWSPPKPAFDKDDNPPDQPNKDANNNGRDNNNRPSAPDNNNDSDDRDPPPTPPPPPLDSEPTEEARPDEESEFDTDDEDLDEGDNVGQGRSEQESSDIEDDDEADEDVPDEDEDEGDQDIGDEPGDEDVETDDETDEPTEDDSTDEGDDDDDEGE